MLTEKELAEILSIYFNDTRVKPIHNHKGTSLLLYLGNSNSLKPWELPGYRKPWDLIPSSHYRAMNFFVTINPDPNTDWYTTDTDKKVIIPLFLNLMQKLKNLDIIKKSISIYEYGKHGKKNGKLHFHCLISTKEKMEMLSQMYKLFNKRRNLKHCTVDCRHIKSVCDRNQMIHYLKKEQQNKLKCLFIN